VIHPHIADALKIPDLVRLTDGLVLIRFESMKIYSALAAVRHLLERGTIRPGQTLIDSSSGIYAYALALACHRYDMRCHIVASTTVDTTTRAQLEILGATVEQVRPSENLKLDQELRGGACGRSWPNTRAATGCANTTTTSTTSATTRSPTGSRPRFPRPR
jgi:cysteine synthase A